MHELMFQAGVKGMSERSELIPCTVLPGKRANFFNSLFLWSKELQYTYNISRYHKTLLFQGWVLTQSGSDPLFPYIANREAIQLRTDLE